MADMQEKADSVLDRRRTIDARLTAAAKRMGLDLRFDGSTMGPTEWTYAVAELLAYWFESAESQHIWPERTETKDG